MDFATKRNVPNARDSANVISKLLFLWIFPLFWRGNKEDLSIDDLYNVPVDNTSENLTKRLEKEWDEETVQATKNKQKPKLLKALLRAFGQRYATFVFIFMVDAWVIRVAQPIFLRLFVVSFSDPSVTALSQSLFAFGLCLTTLIHILLNHPTAFQMCVSGMRCRVATSSLIYRKTLRLSHSSQGKSSVGQIVNLLANDVSRFDYNLHFIAFFFVGPVQLLIFFCILYAEIGPASIAGVGYILLLSPSQYFIGKLSAKFRAEIAKFTDERSKTMSEVVAAIRLIKMYTWEKSFSKVITGIRRMEIRALQKRSLLRAAFMGVFTSNFTYVPFLAILAYALTGNHVTADKAFFTVAIFNVMTEIMMYYVPNAAATMGELMASIKRIEDFLMLEEHDINENMMIKDCRENDDSFKMPPHLQMESVFACWEHDKATLEDFTLNIKGDQLVMVVGPVGCGKSSFLQTIIKELPIKIGRCSIQGSTAYTPQESWIFPGTVRQNIVMGRNFWKERYTEILRVCALEDDLEKFASGDMTIVGDRGVSLSGGQRARITLARALYQDADIYLLDDPLSAVDAGVSRIIFDRCIRTYLDRKLRILVTHQLQYLPHADHVIVITDGRILAEGSYHQLITEGIDFVDLLAHDDADDDDISKANNITGFHEVTLSKSSDCEMDKKEERIVVGSGSATYFSYFRAGDSLFGLGALAFGFALTQLLISSTDYWLSFWTQAEEKDSEKNQRLHAIASFQSDSNFEQDPVYSTVQDESYPDYFNRNVYIIVYASLASGVFIVDTIRTIFFFTFCMRISNNVHQRMFSSVVRAPIKFFDDNPIGRIINRFTKDIGALDEYLPIAIFDTLDIGHRTIGVLVIVILSNYYLAFPSALLLFSYWYLRKFFVKTSRNIKRIESVTRSPLFTHLASTMQGLTVIRSSKAENIVISQFDTYQDLHSASWYHFIAGNNWFSIWLEMMSTVFVTIVTYSFLLLSTSMSSGKVGLAVASLLQLMNTFQFGMRQSAEAENLMTSVERCLEYTKINSEATLNSKKGKSPPPGWSSNGSITFKEVSLAYDNQMDVLKHLSFRIAHGEKIGIVGRTGAGKSSILTALFRLVEARGEITVGGVVAATLGLHDLRKVISIIPQEPFLFSGTVRYNLDPFEKFSDEELWNVIDEVELKDVIPALDYMVWEGGCNFSVGQRQLICLARAILRKNKILVLDEATANVDPRTEGLIRQTLRTKFGDCTIITIAHRLDTVMECDRVFVLENGYLKEDDHPYVLLQNPNGYLTSMVLYMGKSSHAKIRLLAANAYQSRKRHSIDSQPPTRDVNQSRPIANGKQ